MKPRFGQSRYDKGMTSQLREQAQSIWQAGVDAVRPDVLMANALADARLHQAIGAARRIIVVGGGMAGAAMAAALEDGLGAFAGTIDGLLNVPAESVRPLKSITLRGARPAGSNQPTAAGAESSRAMLDLVQAAGPDDLVICLLSGGGSALLPAPADGITLEDKQHVTLRLHECGASINEMNAVRKHLSRIKGGGLVRDFHGMALFSLIISDVVGDPLDVIASGPTAADSSTFADALAVLEGYRLLERVPAAVVQRLRAGKAGKIAETLKELPANMHNLVIGNNALALQAAATRARALGYAVCDLGPFIEGETRQVGIVLAGLARAIRAGQGPVSPPACLLSGGETTVTLAPDHGKGGRNQELVLACALKLGAAAMNEIVVLSGGTDGEDGPTDAAGALADAATLPRAAQLGLDPQSFLNRNDAYTFFQATGSLLKTGLTQTNVMDVRVILIA
jgi:hydroxypyruvate reductase/glycerate 2-kinase